MSNKPTFKGTKENPVHRDKTKENKVKQPMGAMGLALGIALREAKDKERSVV